VFIVAASGLSLVTVTATLVSVRVEHQPSLIQPRYMPKLELGPKWESELEHIVWSLQDTLAAQDRALLEESRAFKGARSLPLSAAHAAAGQ
jgi:hypothetical protein